MKVCGSSNQQSPPTLVMRPTRPKNFGCVCKRTRSRFCQVLHPPEAGVVARALVLRPGLPRPDDQFHRHRRLVAARIQRPARPQAASGPRLSALGRPSPELPAADYFLSPVFLLGLLLVAGCRGTAAGAAPADRCSFHRQLLRLRARPRHAGWRWSATTAIVAGAQLHGFHAVRQLQLRQVNRVADCRFARSTSMNSGRSSGRQMMSISFITWFTTPPPVFTPGRSPRSRSAAAPSCGSCSFADALEVDVQHLRRHGCICRSRSSTGCLFAVQVKRQDRRVKASCFRC